MSSTQLIVGILALALTYLTALAVGYRAKGSLLILFSSWARSPASPSMAFSVLVAAFLRTVFDLVTVGCFPFFILMFFSGGMFPLPGVALFQLGDRAIELNEILPTTHAITALNRVLSYNAGLGDIGYESGRMIILTPGSTPWGLDFHAETYAGRGMNRSQVFQRCSATIAKGVSGFSTDVSMTKRCLK